MEFVTLFFQFCLGIMLFFFGLFGFIEQFTYAGTWNQGTLETWFYRIMFLTFFAMGVVLLSATIIFIITGVNANDLHTSVDKAIYYIETEFVFKE